MTTSMLQSFCQILSYSETSLILSLKKRAINTSIQDNSFENKQEISTIQVIKNKAVSKQFCLKIVLT